MTTNKTMFAAAALTGILSAGFATKAATAIPDGSSHENRSTFGAGHPAADEKSDKDKNSCKGKSGCPAKK